MLYNRYVPLKIGICLFLTACATEEVKIPILPWTPPPDQQITVHNDLLIDVLDYKDSSLKDIPIWVAAYYNGENIESMPQYSDKYLFINRQTGNRLNVLGQFSIEKDFPLLIASRVQNALIHDLNTYPDAVYGAFFEETVKAFYDAKFEGVLKEDDFWIKRQITWEDETHGEVFDFLTMVSVDRRLLVSQINTLLSNVNPSKKTTNDQATAVTYIKNNFINNF